MHEAGEADVRIRQRVVDRRRDDGADRRRDAPGDLVGNQDIGEQRRVRAVLFRCAGRNDHRMMRFEKGLDFGIRHLAEEHGRWLHQSSS